MAISSSPFETEHHELVVDDELERVAQIHDDLIRGQTQERIRDLRSSVVARLGELGALGSKGGWAVFDLSEEEDGAVATVGETHASHALVLAFESQFSSSLKQRPLSVRIVFDRIFRSMTGSVAISAEQVLIDQDDDAFHGYHGGLHNQETDKVETFYLPLFSVRSDGSLDGHGGAVAGYLPPHIVAVEKMFVGGVNGRYYDPGSQDVLVNGSYDDPFDAAFAVNRGQEMLEEALGGGLFASGGLNAKLIVSSPDLN